MKTFIFAITATMGLSLAGVTGTAEAHGHGGCGYRSHGWSSYCYRPTCYSYSCYDYGCCDNTCYGYSCSDYGWYGSRYHRDWRGHRSHGGRRR